jgi:hypothetical protein
MQVDIAEGADGYSGDLRISRASEASEPRHVHGVTCREVVDALAVVTAMALNADGAAGDPQTPPPPTSPPARVAEPSPPAPPTPPAPAQRPPLRATHTWPVPFQPGDKAVEVPAGKLRFESVTAVTALGGVALGVAPGPMPRVDVQLSRANFVTVPGGDSYLTGVVWRVRATLLADVTFRRYGSTAEVGGQSVGAGACYSPIFDSGGLELLFCMEIGAGLIRVHTHDDGAAQTHSKNAGLGTFGLGTELAYNIGRHFHVGLKLGGDASTASVMAERENGTAIFATPWFSSHGMLGLGGHW